MHKNLLKQLLFVFLIITNVQAADVYDVKEGSFWRLRRCFIQVLKDSENNQKVIQDNIKIFYKVCADKFYKEDSSLLKTPKITLSLIKDDIKKRKIYFTANIFESTQEILNTYLINTDFLVDPLKDFNTINILEKYINTDRSLPKLPVVNNLIQQFRLTLNAQSSINSPRPKRLSSFPSVSKHPHKAPLTACCLPLVLEANEENDKSIPFLKPKQAFAKIMTQEKIKDALKKVIIGQDTAMDELAMLGYQILLEKAHTAIDSTWNFKPPHKLIFGGTGTGKTYSIRALANILDIPFIEVNAPGLVDNGIVGTSLDDIYFSEFRTKTGSDRKFAIIFLDEIGKMCSTHFGSSVMKILLSHMNGVTVQVPIPGSGGASFDVDTSCFTYIGADACSMFHKKTSEILPNDLLKPEFGMTRELLGRFTGIVKLQPHSDSSLLRILKDAQKSPYKHIQDLFEKTFEAQGISAQVKLEITDDGLLAIAKRAYENGDGARILEEVFNKVMHPILKKPNDYIALFNDAEKKKAEEIKKAREESEQKVVSTDIMSAAQPTTLPKKIKEERKKSILPKSLGYKIQLSPDRKILTWTIEESFVEDHLPPVQSKQDPDAPPFGMFN